MTFEKIFGWTLAAFIVAGICGVLAVSYVTRSIGEAVAIFGGRTDYYPDHESTEKHYYAVCGQDGCIYYNIKAACERSHRGACAEETTRGPMPTED
jgi:hypothetical protein